MLKKFLLHLMYLNADYPAKFPVDRNLRNKLNEMCEKARPLKNKGSYRRAKTHVAISPVEAGIRAGELRNLAFPCDALHSGLFKFFANKNEAFSYRCGDSARLGSASRLTPMPNRHQSTINGKIISQRSIKNVNSFIKLQSGDHPL
jgi:hypothetical protein